MVKKSLNSNIEKKSINLSGIYKIGSNGNITAWEAFLRVLNVFIFRGYGKSGHRKLINERKNSGNKRS